MPSARRRKVRTNDHIPQGVKILVWAILLVACAVFWASMVCLFV